MAVPALTANSPSAGYIAWAAFTCQYGGVAYPVSAGNTNLIFTAWLYNSGSPVVVSNNNTPANSNTDSTSAIWAGSSPTLGPDDLLLFVNRSGVPINVQAASMLDGDLIVTGTVTSNAIATNTIVASNIAAGAITTSQIAANTILASNIAAGTITATQIAASTITSANIAAGSIGASSLTVGTLSSNLIINSMFEDIDSGGNITPWLGNWLSGSTATPVGSTTSPVIDGSRSGAITVTASLTGDLTSNAFPVTPGHTMYVNAYFAASAINVKATVALVFGTTQTFTNSGFVSATPAAPVNVSVTDLSGNIQTGVSSSESAGRVNVVNAWPCATASTIYMATGQFTVPALAQWARLALVGVGGTAGVLYVDDAEVDDVILSAFIGNGQITTNQLNATAINGMTIVGALIETAANLASGNGNLGISIQGGGDADRIFFYTNTTVEATPGELVVGTIGSGTSIRGAISLIPPAMTGYSYAGGLVMTGYSEDGTLPPAVTIEANSSFSVNGATYLNSTLEVTGTTTAAAINGTTINGSADMQVNSLTLPRGTVGKASATNAVTVTTTETAIMSGVASCTIVSGRRYRVWAWWIGAPSAASTTTTALAIIRLGSGTGGAALAEAEVAQGTTAGISFYVCADFVGGTDVAAGTQTFTLTCKAGTGSIVGGAASNVANRQRLVVEDIGT